MNKNIKVSNKKIISFDIFTTFFLILLIGIGIFYFQKSILNNSFDILDRFNGIILFFFSIPLIKTFLQPRIFEIDENFIYAKSCFGLIKSSFHINEIMSWMEFVKTDDGKESKELILYTANNKYKVESEWLDDYDSFKDILTKDVPRNELKEFKIKSRNRLSFAFLLIFLGSFSFILIQYSFKRNNLNNDSLSYLTGTIKNKAIVKKSDDDEKYLELKLKEYPELIFEIVPDSENKLTKENLEKLENIKDSITLEIKNEIYDKYITKKVSRNILDKIFNSNKIKVFGVKANNITYVQPSNFKKHFSFLNYLILLFPFIMVIFLYLPNKKSKINP